MKVFDDDGMFTPEADALVRRYARAVVDDDDDERADTRGAAPDPLPNVFDDLDVSMALALVFAED